MSYSSFYNTARAIAYTVRNPPNYTDLLYAENHATLQGILDDLVANVILYNWQAKVDMAAAAGQTFTTLYRYFRTDMYQDYPVELLINGPQENPNFFVENGYDSVMNQLNTILAPGVSTNYFSANNKGSKIVLNWNN